MKQLSKFLMIIGLASLTAACSSSASEENGSTLVKSSSSSLQSVAAPVAATPNVNTSSDPQFANVDFHADSNNTTTGGLGDLEGSNDPAAQNSGEANGDEEAEEEEIENLEALLDHQAEMARIAQQDAHSQRMAQTLSQGYGGDEMTSQMMELVMGIMMINGMTNIVSQSVNPDPCNPSAAGIDPDQTSAILNAVFMSAAMDAANK